MSFAGFVHNGSSLLESFVRMLHLVQGRLQPSDLLNRERKSSIVVLMRRVPNFCAFAWDAHPRIDDHWKEHLVYLGLVDFIVAGCGILGPPWVEQVTGVVYQLVNLITGKVYQSVNWTMGKVKKEDLSSEDLVQPLQLIMIGLVKTNLLQQFPDLNVDDVRTLVAAIEGQFAFGAQGVRLVSIFQHIFLDGVVDFGAVFPESMAIQFVFATEEVLVFWIKVIIRVLRVSGVAQDPLDDQICEDAGEVSKFASLHGVARAVDCGSVVALGGKMRRWERSLQLSVRRMSDRIARCMVT